MASTTQESRRWTGGIDYQSLRAALDFLDVKLPVNIRRANGRQTRGAHRFRNGEHCITISTYSTVAQASRIALHELTHAAQVERFETPTEFYVAYKRDTATHGRGYAAYRANKFEVEAREAEDLAEDFPIAKA